MGFYICLNEDIENTLRALASAGRLQKPGYIEALRDMATALGVRPPMPIQTWRVVNDDVPVALALARG